MYFIQHCFICRPSDSTVSEDAGMEPRTGATSAMAVGRPNLTRLDLIHIFLFIVSHVFVLLFIYLIVVIFLILFVFRTILYSILGVFPILYFLYPVLEKVLSVI
jgi:hypothetical protein